MLLSFLILTERYAPRRDSNMSKHYSYIQLYAKTNGIESNSIPTVSKPKRKTPVNSEAKQYVLQRDTFFCNAGTMFYPAGKKYYRAFANNWQILSFQKNWIENNEEWFKVWEEKKFSSNDVMWILRRYLDKDCPYVTFAELLQSYEERMERERKGMKYKI